MDKDTFPYLSIFPATAEQQLVYLRGAAEQWGVPNGVTIDEFVAGYKAISTLVHASEGKTTNWSVH